MSARHTPASGLTQDSGFARVVNGNAVEGPFRRRAKLSRSIARLARALLRWLAQPTPWQRRP